VGLLRERRISGSNDSIAPAGSGMTMHTGSSLSKRTVPGRVSCQFIVNG